MLFLLTLWSLSYDNITEELEQLRYNITIMRLAYDMQISDLYSRDIDNKDDLELLTRIAYSALTLVSIVICSFFIYMICMWLCKPSNIDIDY